MIIDYIQTENFDNSRNYNCTGGNPFYRLLQNSFLEYPGEEIGQGISTYLSVYVHTVHTVHITS